MRITNLLFWVQENQLSEKFYKKLGFEVLSSDDTHSIVGLHGFTIDLVSMRDEEKFAKDAMAGDKGRGMYLYINVDDIRTTHKEFVALGLSPTDQKDWSWGNREFVLKDPDGYKLCFWQATKGQDS